MPFRGQLLSIEERRVLAALDNVESAAAAARALGLDTPTVRAHLRSAVVKLGVRTNWEALEVWRGGRNSA